MLNTYFLQASWLFRLFHVYLSRQSPLPLFDFQKIIVIAGQAEELNQWLPLFEIFIWGIWRRQIPMQCKITGFSALNANTILVVSVTIDMQDPNVLTQWCNQE